MKEVFSEYYKWNHQRIKEKGVLLIA